jgi:hypothetical protein
VQPHGHYGCTNGRHSTDFTLAENLGQQPHTVFLSRCDPQLAAEAVVLSTARRLQILREASDFLPTRGEFKAESGIALYPRPLKRRGFSAMTLDKSGSAADRTRVGAT